MEEALDLHGIDFYVEVGSALSNMYSNLSCHILSIGHFAVRVKMTLMKVFELNIIGSPPIKF